MSNTLYWLEGPWPGRLAILARPRGGDWLADDVAAWRRAGLNVVVSLLTPAENLELGLTHEGDMAQQQKLEHISFSIPDRQVPLSLTKASEVIQQLRSSLAEGKHIGIHCRLGIGRSALLAASLLVASHLSAAQAFECIEKARGMAVPDTPEQRQWVEQFEQLMLPVSS